MALAACAGLTPADDDQLRQVRAFVETTARSYGVSAPRIVVEVSPSRFPEYLSGSVRL